MSDCCLTPNEQYEELGISKNSGKPYKNTNFDKEDILANHKSFMSSLNIPINEENCELSTLYWIPKFQKNQYLDRYIPGSSTCPTKELSITMTNIVHAVKGGLLLYCAKIYSRGNINQKHRIDDVMVSVLASSAIDRGFEPRSGQTKDYTIGMCCFSAKYTALRRKSKLVGSESEKFEDTKGAIRNRISKKNRQHNGEKKKYKRTNNDRQNIHIKLKIV